MGDTTKDLRDSIIWSDDHMETKRLANILANRTIRYETEIAHLREIIDKAKVDPDAESTGESAVDNSYTGQIAQLKHEIKTLDKMLDSSMCGYCDFMNEKLNEYIDKTKFAERKLYTLLKVAHDMRSDAVDIPENEWIVWNCAADRIVDVISDQELT